MFYFDLRDGDLRILPLLAEYGVDLLAKDSDGLTLFENPRFMRDIDVLNDLKADGATPAELAHTCIKRHDLAGLKKIIAEQPALLTDDDIGMELLWPAPH